MATPPSRKPVKTAAPAAPPESTVDILPILVSQKVLTAEQAERVRRTTRLNSVPAEQAVIQLASTLRNLGEADEAVDLLTDWLAENDDHELSDSAAAFLALALASAGRTTEALTVALDTLAPHLTQYGRSVAAYAEWLSTD